MYGNSPFGTFTSDPFPDIQPVRSPYINDYVVNVVVQMTMGNVTTTEGALVICSLTLITNRLDKLGPFGSYPCPYADTLTYSFMLPNGLLYVQSQNNNDSANMITFQQLCSSYYSKFRSVTFLVNLFNLGRCKETFSFCSQTRHTVASHTVNTMAVASTIFLATPTAVCAPRVGLAKTALVSLISFLILFRILKFFTF
jgi:hypothetical protein